MGFKQRVGFGPKKLDDTKTAMKKGDTVTTQNVATEAAEAAPDAAKQADEVARGNKAASEGLMKTGMYVTGGTILLMMMYDTLNPFEAIHKAVKDTGQTVKGLKEVADSAATAAKDVTKGGFNFVSFVTNNSWLSSSSSILCLILIFAVTMMTLFRS